MRSRIATSKSVKAFIAATNVHVTGAQGLERPKGADALGRTCRLAGYPSWLLFEYELLPQCKLLCRAVLNDRLEAPLLQRHDYSIRQQFVC